MFRQMLPGVFKTSMERKVLIKISGSLVTFLRVVHEKAAEVGRLDMASLDAVGQKQAFQSEFNRVAPQKGDAVLYLSQEHVLCKKLNLPLAAEENLRQVIAFEMDRHTPFHAGQVYFDYRFVHRGEQLEISLAVAPRNAIDETLRQLAIWGAQAVAVLVEGDATNDAPWSLLPDGLLQKSKGARLPRLNTALTAGAVMLLCVALALPIWQKRETVLALRPQLDNARKQAEAAEDLRRQLEAMMANYNYLLNKKRESPPVVAVLEDVTRILPDDTWVQQFDLKGNEVIIQGETATSSTLVGLFEQAKTLHNASFRAPLTKGLGVNSERFQLAVETRPLPRAETEPQPILPVQPPQQPPVTQPEQGLAVVPEVTGAPAAQGKGKADKQPAAPEAIKADNPPATKKTEVKPGSAPSARTERQP